MFIKVNVKVSLAGNKRDELYSSSPVPQMQSFTFLSVHKSEAGSLLGNSMQTLTFFIYALFSFLWLGGTKFPNAETHVIALQLESSLALWTL